MARQWCLSAWCLGFLLLTGGASASEQMSGQFVGMFGESAINLILHETAENAIAGTIEQTWIDSAGREKSGQADVRGVEHDDTVTLYLTPKGIIKLPIALTMHRTQTGLAVQGEGQDKGKASAANLHPGSDVAYLKVLAQLPAPQIQPAVRKNASLMEELEKTGAESGEGCQCSAEKKTHVVDATIVFSRQTTDLLADLSDYLAGIEANRNLIDIRSAGNPNSRQGIMAFTEIFHAVGQDLEMSLNAAVEKCSHRQLAEGDAATREAKLWRDTCLSVADGLDRYRREQSVISASSR